MNFFSLLHRCGSFTATAREFNLSVPAVSKRLAQLEGRLGVQLLHRTTRRTSLTSEGEIYLSHARRILAEIDEMEQQVSNSVVAPKGLLRVNATPGYGRSHIAPLVSRFVTLHPAMQVQLQLTVNPPPVSEDAFDVCVCFGEPLDARVIAHRLAPNRRILCAAPAYLSRQGSPNKPTDLASHNCICIRQGDEAYGVWRLRSGDRMETIKVHGDLSTSDGEIAVNWALAGHGIVMRAEWDIARYLRSGRLRQVLEKYRTPPADIHVVYPQRHQVSGRVRAFVNFMVRDFDELAARAASSAID